MREIKLIQFTYEDVRLALQKAFPHLDIEGVKTSGRTGYLAETCTKADEPWSRPEEPGKEAA